MERIQFDDQDPILQNKKVDHLCSVSGSSTLRTPVNVSQDVTYIALVRDAFVDRVEEVKHALTDGVFVLVQLFAVDEVKVLDSVRSYTRVHTQARHAAYTQEIREPHT